MNSSPVEQNSAASPVGVDGPGVVDTWSDGGLDLLSPSQYDNVRSTLPTDGQFSSDGEFTAIANREVAQLGASQLDMDGVKTEPAVAAAGAAAGNHVAVVNDAAILSQLLYPPPPALESNAATGRDPSTQNWSGDLVFDARVPAPVKSKDAQFSDKLGKLFINQNRLVNMYFKVRPDESYAIPAGLYIRAVVIYASPDHYPEPVKVCYAHARRSDGMLKKPISEHLIVTENPNSGYYQDSVSARQSVLTCLPEVQPGCTEVVIGYRFMDLGSCPGGLNRRDTAVIFTLEFGGDIIGRKVVPVRICTCPKRDLETEEKVEERKSPAAVEPTSPANTVAIGQGKVKMEKRAGLKDGQEVYWVMANGRDNYEALKNLGQVLERKDGGDVAKYTETMEKFNGLSRQLCKRRRGSDSHD